MTSKEVENMDAFEACRTCGIFYQISSDYLRALFEASDQNSDGTNSDMIMIQAQLLAWNVMIGENDGFPQYICISCIHEFQKVFKFRRSCIEVQQDLRNLYSLGDVKIKTELPDPDSNMESGPICCDFIYVDELSDNEHDGGAAITPFNIPHVPIKTELIEEAAVPNDICESAFETAATKKSTYTSHINYNAIETCLMNRELEETLRCNACLYKASTSQDLQKHTQLIHEVKDLECHICGKQFKNSTAHRLKFHMRWHKLSKHIKCAQCGFYCNSRDTLKQHVRARHVKITCELCGLSMSAKKMKSHMREHNNTANWKCSYCNMEFDSDVAREEHIWQTHISEHIALQQTDQYDTPSANSFIQMFANESVTSGIFDSNVTMIKDTESMSPQQTTAFIKVQEPTQHKDDLDNLDNSCTNNYSHDMDDGNEFLDRMEEFETTQTTELSQIACANCTQMFVSVEELLIHHEEHLKPRSKFECNICEKQFDLKFSLNRHMKKHNKC